MKQKEIGVVVDSGTPCALLEYRGGKGEHIVWTGKVSGKQEEAKQYVHCCEMRDGTQVKIVERLKNDVHLPDIQPKAKKGQKVLVTLRSWEVDKGNITARGDIFPLED
jgi:hypothetical protein